MLSRLALVIALCSACNARAKEQEVYRSGSCWNFVFLGTMRTIASIAPTQKAIQKSAVD